jgi:serine/threonine protein kinase
MSDDSAQTQRLDDEGWRRAREVSLKRGLPPTRVPGYDMERCLGEGAYGEVWVARDRNNPGRRVAIKFYTQGAGDWALLAREVEKLNFLATDRYIVQLLDVSWNTEPPYYIMEFMESGSLADRLQQGPLPVKEAVSVFREIARGVLNAHNRGVLHCDLKPANVLIGLDGKPRLADFGQSRLSREQHPALGTLFFMAPEQADLSATPDARWDVYALGALLYCLVTGEPPFRDLPAAAALDEPVPLAERLVRYRRLLQEAPPPRKHRSQRGMDRTLADIIDRCLAISPAKRFPNVQSLLNALDARAVRRARRPLLVLGALGPVLLLLLMGGQVAQELNSAVDTAKDSLTVETRYTDRFAAQALAERVASKIDRRWRILENEGNESDFKKLLVAAHGKAVDSREHEALQAGLDEARGDHTKTVGRAAWTVFDDKGYMLARSPSNARSDAHINNKTYTHRDYFNGKANLREGESAPPLVEPYRSNVFVSNATETRVVAFSVPVFEDKWGPDEPRLGVLMMTVDIGDFIELQADEQGKGSMAVLIDTRPEYVRPTPTSPETKGQIGAILQHPVLSALRKQGVVEKDDDRFKLYGDLMQFDGDGWCDNYHDTVGDADPHYAGRWLAASAPVIVEEREQAGNTGWVVVVQEHYDDAIGPVVKLKNDMLRRGVWAMAVAVTLVTGLWMFVIFVLSDVGRARWLSSWKKRLGLAVDSARTAKASESEPKPARPAPPTVTDG